MYFLLAMGAGALQGVLTAMFLGLCVLLLVEGFREGRRRSATAASRC